MINKEAPSIKKNLKEDPVQMVSTAVMISLLNCAQRLHQIARKHGGHDEHCSVHEGRACSCHTGRTLVDLKKSLDEFKKIEGIDL